MRISPKSITRFGAKRSPVSLHGDQLFRRMSITGWGLCDDRWVGRIRRSFTLGVAPSGFYQWLKCPQSARAVEDARLLRLIHASFEARQGISGAPRVFLDLREAGETCSQHRVARLMRENGLRALHGHRTRRLKVGKPALRAPKLRRFCRTNHLEPSMTPQPGDSTQTRDYARAADPTATPALARRPPGFPLRTETHFLPETRYCAPASRPWSSTNATPSSWTTYSRR